MKQHIIIILVFFLGLQFPKAQQTNAIDSQKSSSISGIFKTELYSLYLGVINLGYEMPHNKSSYTISGAVAPVIGGVELGFDYNYYLLKQAPYGLYLSPGVSVGYIDKYSEAGVSASIRAGYNFIYKDKISIDLSAGIGTSSLTLLDNSKYWVVGLSVGLPLKK